MSVELEWPDGIEELSYEEFERRVHDGLVPPDTPIRFEVVTGKRFVLAEELELFQTLADPDIRRFRSSLRNLGIPLMTAVLVGVQLRIYLLAKTPGGSDWMVEQLANWSPAILEGGEVHRLLSYGFLQIGFTHLLVNLLFLAYVGWNLERGLGRRNLLTIFLFSIFCGGLLSLLMSPGRPSLGSSGGDFGLLAAAVVFGWKHGDMIPERARKFFGWGVLPYLVLSLGLGLRSSGVDNWGHFGGLLGGGLMATLLEPDFYRKYHRANRLVRRVTLLSAIGAMCALAYAGPQLLRTRTHYDEGLLTHHPTSWPEEWTFGGDRGWASPTGRATFVARTAVYGRPLSAAQATEAVLNQLDAWGSAPVILRQESVWIGDLEAIRIRVEFEEAGRTQEMEALLIPRGHLLHRIQLFSDANWSWRYRGLADKLFGEVRVLIPPALQVARRLAGGHQSDASVFVQLGDAAAMAGFWAESRSGYEKAFEIGAPEEQMARATEGMLLLYRDTGMDIEVPGILKMAVEFPGDVAVQIAAAEALEGKGEMEEARGVLLRASTANADDFSLRRALAERRLAIPDLSAPNGALRDSDLSPGHGEGLP
jgi:rhomboid protease GluP